MSLNLAGGTAIVLGIFIPIAILGHIQTWGFTYDEVDRKEHSPPPLYDQIKTYPFWQWWVYSIAPLIPLTSAVQSLMPDFEGSLYVFFALNFIYYYLWSCVFPLILRTVRTSGLRNSYAASQDRD